MKNILKVTILFCLIIGLFIIPSFANNYILTSVTVWELTVDNQPTQNAIAEISTDNTNNVFIFYVTSSTQVKVYCASEYSGQSVIRKTYNTSTNAVISNLASNLTRYNNILKLYYTPSYILIGNVTDYDSPNVETYNINIPSYSSVEDALQAIRYNIDNPPDPTPTYTKNANVDEFIANTLISMGVKFDTPADALSYASDAWDWCIDEDNMESANPFDEWNIDSFVSYCNAQSNNYLNWYNGYKVSKDVTNALGEYIRQNIRSLSGLPSGITSLTVAYLPIYHYGSGFQSGASSPTAQTFYPAQTISYFNGEYVNETNDISTSQFLYTPSDVRRFLGYPGSSPTITPSSPTGTGTITNDPNNPDQKNININFPALDWLADAIKSILDFLRDAFTTLANLLTQLLDAILGLFSDAFDSLSEFGQGIIEWLYAIVAGFSTIGGNYIPASLWAVILPFILINIGVGLIMFVLRSH